MLKTLHMIKNHSMGRQAGKQITSLIMYMAPICYTDVIRDTYGYTVQEHEKSFNLKMVSCPAEWTPLNNSEILYKYNPLL